MIINVVMNFLALFFIYSIIWPGVEMATAKKKKKKRKSKKKETFFLIRFFSLKNNKGNFSMLRLIRNAFLFLLLFTLVSCSTLYVMSPDVSWLNKKNPKTTSMIEERNDYFKSQGKPQVKLKHWVHYKSLPVNLVRAVRISEDDRFFQHNGFDFKQLWESIKGTLSEGKNLRGASTITQQLAKNLFLSSSRSIFRKIREIPIVIKLERDLSKKRIFEIYINVIEFGNGVYGIESAARHYFGKYTADLNLDECIFLAAIISNPRYYESHRFSKSFLFRQDTILYRMAVYGYIK